MQKGSKGGRESKKECKKTQTNGISKLREDYMQQDTTRAEIFKNQRGFKILNYC